MKHPIKTPSPKLTKKRAAVLAVVRTTESHLTANEVFNLASQKLAGISFATVYNALRYLTEQKLIGEIKFGDGASRFDRRTDRHDHAFCTACGTLVDFAMEEILPLMRSAARRTKFKAEAIHLTLYGLCAN